MQQWGSSLQSSNHLTGALGMAILNSSSSASFLPHPTSSNRLQRERISILRYLGNRFPSTQLHCRTWQTLCGFIDLGTHHEGSGAHTGSSQDINVVQTMRMHENTYGSSHTPWLADELGRLLSIQKKPSSGMVLTRGSWSWDVQQPHHYRFRGVMQFCNVTTRHEIFINEVVGRALLLSNDQLDQVMTLVKVQSMHPGCKPRPREDGYWRAYITRAGEATAIEVVVTIKAKGEDSLEKLQALRVEIEYVSYGPHGRSSDSQYAVLPLQYPRVSSSTWQRVENLRSVLPIKTHLLCHMDDPLNVLQSYALPYAKAGDVIAIGETPLAIMQGRFRHPCGVYPSLLAKLACRLFHPTSSLATACGMQALIDISGSLRVLFAILIAAIARLFGVRGMFYRLAGEQARLIDDVTGTLPPYDQFITLGPVHTQAVVDALRKKTGLGIAIVDVNDLKQVEILAASDDVNHKHLKQALLDNPSGNEDEQTPIVIIREVQESENFEP